MRASIVFAAAMFVDCTHAALSVRVIVGPHLVPLHLSRSRIALAKLSASRRNWKKDERTRRAALEAAFTQIDKDGDSTLDFEELCAAGFDAEYLFEKLDANKDGFLSRNEFVDSLVAMYTSEGPCSEWEMDDLAALQRCNELLPFVDKSTPSSPGSVWGSRTIRRAITEPRFELVSLVAVLVTSLSYAVGTLNDLSAAQRFWLAMTEDFFTVVFAVEYVLRWWGRSFSKRSLVEPAGIIDLLSFAPLLVQLITTTATSGPFVTDAMPFEVSIEASGFAFAFLRLLRVLRLQRYVQDIQSFRRFEEALGLQTEVKPYQLEVARVITSIFTLLFISSGLIYNAEHIQNPQLPDFFTALYFGLTTLTTVGFGDITPITAEGRLVVSASILVGVAIIPVQLSSLAEALLGRGSISLPASSPAVTMAPCRVCGATDHPADASFCYRCGTSYKVLDR